MSNAARGRGGWSRGAVGLAGGVVLAAGAAAGAGLEHAALGVRLRTPVPFSAPADVGLETVALSHPPDAAPGEATCEVVLSRVDAAMRESFGNDDGALLEYVKSTFLGTAKPASGSAQRVILGRPSTGQTLTTGIPRPGRLEVHLVALADGGRLAVAVRSFGDDAAELGERVMTALAESLAEDGAAAP